MLLLLVVRLVLLIVVLVILLLFILVLLLFIIIIKMDLSLWFQKCETLDNLVIVISFSFSPPCCPCCPPLLVLLVVLMSSLTLSSIDWCYRENPRSPSRTNAENFECDFFMNNGWRDGRTDGGKDGRTDGVTYTILRSRIKMRPLYFL